MVGLGGLRDRRVDERQLEEGADTGQVVEARAGNLGAALDVDGAQCLAELQVVLGLEALGAEVADGAVRLQDDEVLLAADRDVGVDEVAELEQEALGLLVGLVLLGVGRLDVGGQLTGLGQQFGLLVAGGPGDELAERLLLGTQLVEADAGRPAPLVGRQEGVDEGDVLSTGALGGAHSVGVLTEQAKVNHAVKATGAGTGPTTHYYRTRFTYRYAVIAHCVNKKEPTPGTGHDPGTGLTRLPCVDRDLGRGCPQGSTPSEELSTGCAVELWISELITPKPGDHAADSRIKPLLTPTFEWKVVAPKDCARENSGRRVMCAPVDEDEARRPICRQGGHTVSTCPQVEKLACG